MDGSYGFPADLKYQACMDLDKQSYTVAEIAKRWSCSPDKVNRIFRGLPRVMDLGAGCSAAD